MQGYYKNPEVTSKVLDEDGWFNTGDLGWITTKGDLVISGRAKDTIVLSSGENVEPEPIELAAMQSPCVSQILVVGQDQKSLGALVYPDFVQLAAKLGVSPEIAPSEIIANPNAQKIVRESIAEAMGKQFKSQEQVLKIAFLTEGFTEANGMLTLTMKPKRKVILAHYSELIDSMFSRN
jgi:long-chain acyl-CoA synthetase